MTLLLRRNADPALPASHTADIRFTLPRDVGGGGVENVPGVLMKLKETTRGTPLAGMAVKVAQNVFLVGLSKQPADLAQSRSAAVARLDRYPHRLRQPAPRHPRHRPRADMAARLHPSLRRLEPGATGGSHARTPAGADGALRRQRFATRRLRGRSASTLFPPPPPRRSRRVDLVRRASLCDSGDGIASCGQPSDRRGIDAFLVCSCMAGSVHAAFMIRCRPLMAAVSLLAAVAGPAKAQSPQGDPAGAAHVVLY